jgi:small subunit ribosomal protein S3
MGQKVNPHGLRVGVIKDWDSAWYADKANYADYLVEDNALRNCIKKFLNDDLKLRNPGVSKIFIERTKGEKDNGRVKVTIHTSKPGIIIGRKGESIGRLTGELQKVTSNRVLVNIEEIKRPELDSQIVAEDIARQLEERVTFRRAMKSAMSKTMKMGAKGIKTSCSGRLGGAEMARSEHYHDGTIPLQTLRADIDYGFAEADTTYGKIGVKVWIYKGEVLPQKSVKEGSEQ